jgi:hypothetical protein
MHSSPILVITGISWDKVWFFSVEKYVNVRVKETWYYNEDVQVTVPTNLKMADFKK